MSFPDLPLLFLVTLPLLFTSIHADTTFEVENQCSYTVWAAAIPGGGRRLDPGQSWTIPVIADTKNGRIWGRTGCNFSSSGRGSCQTGDCGGLLQCQSSGQPPCTLAEYGFDFSNGLDFFDISLVDGFNIPIDFSPVNGDCKRGVRCSADINGQCPSELQAPGGCNNACTLFKTSNYCCTSGNCGPTIYSLFYKDRCPDAYVYPKDDKNTTFTCPTGTDYRVAFCPSVNPGKVQQPSSPDFDNVDQGPEVNKRGSRGKDRKLRRPIIISVPAASSMALLVFCICYYLWRRKGSRKGKEKSMLALLHPMDTNRENGLQTQDLPMIDFVKVRAATNNFSDENKLGQGGFGPVYKGVLLDGKEIAVKRLSRSSLQGLEEFKNEVTLIAKLQHRNLVKLLYCCIEGEEKLLVYEYMPNTSLDVFLFDPIKQVQLDWEKRYNIVNGIARGLLYMHEDSRLKIIHRDLKASNVLLDSEMNPKISDFGMARIFEGNRSQVNTNRVVGTYGYMAPEYAMGGLFSVKSDVFSFGVLLLEIVSGKRNNSLNLPENAQSLLNYAWTLWCEDRALDLIDPSLLESCATNEALRWIHIGLLCVQEDAADRPNMSLVVFMLKSKIVPLPQPTRPGFFVGRSAMESDGHSSHKVWSINEVTISTLTPR